MTSSNVEIDQLLRFSEVAVALVDTLKHPPINVRAYPPHLNAHQCKIKGAFCFEVFVRLPSPYCPTQSSYGVWSENSDLVLKGCEYFIRNQVLKNLEVLFVKLARPCGEILKFRILPDPVNVFCSFAKILSGLSSTERHHTGSSQLDLHIFPLMAVCVRNLSRDKKHGRNRSSEGNPPTNRGDPFPRALLCFGATKSRSSQNQPECNDRNDKGGNGPKPSVPVFSHFHNLLRSGPTVGESSAHLQWGRV